MTSAKQQLGGRGEDMALEFLTGLGYELVTRNYRSRGGELDLIMRDGTTLVFVEVRTKTVFSHGNPLETIDYRKRRQIEKTARLYLARKKLGDEISCRFDVVGISLDKESTPQIEHVINAFMTGE
ncbi:MAG TPA: YraN family protein [Candidatus Rifleibacterium sp.]|nr:YraN family protein [Candidatus Rifleibacterium sp.]HPT47310.1 YraN family protein [Candidatus Rifleibacterium sp.]